MRDMEITDGAVRPNDHNRGATLAGDPDPVAFARRTPDGGWGLFSSYFMGPDKLICGASTLDKLTDDRTGFLSGLGIRQVLVFL